MSLARCHKWQIVCNDKFEDRPFIINKTFLLRFYFLVDAMGLFLSCSCSLLRVNENKKNEFNFFDDETYIKKSVSLSL